ncbi:aminotransferase class I/II-fold pyridoxal phosphate-dependent enzyme [Kordia jejudonensis]|uniref:aminotransferase class I/II-fold pyridoxal phosphate-dependent enzyme n=1 Tax=Kordia jejudonensis TaxID=1348245 RepID=UPI000629BF06|nr:8-amino-7-oxononanoate synthase [Kordia jejudonensis]
MKLPEKLQSKLQERIQNKTLRILSTEKKAIDFSSNDYLGFGKSESIFNKTHQLLTDRNLKQNGATGSRLLSGNSELYEEVEAQICAFHNSEAALLFNSGYDANIGFFSAVPLRGDVILYDEYIHASIRDGIRMSTAKSYKFKHNDIEDVAKKISNISNQLEDTQQLYIVTESVFSMDGDSPNLVKMIEICNKKNCHLIVDEAHALGVFGDDGEGLLQHLRLEKEVFARIYTFGKALGCHGAAILGSNELKTYLINFARSFIYTTGLSPHAVATIKTAYDQLADSIEVKRLKLRIFTFKQATTMLKFIPSDSAIHCYIIAGNENVIKAAAALRAKGFDVKPIISPTVPAGKERLRFCLHSYNSTKEIKEMIHTLTSLYYK